MQLCVEAGVHLCRVKYRVRVFSISILLQVFSVFSKCQTFNVMPPLNEEQTVQLIISQLKKMRVHSLTHKSDVRLKKKILCRQ